MKETFYRGAAGNLSLHLVTISLAALATEATKVVTDSLPIGTQITGVRIVNEALGTGTKLTAQPVYIGDEGPSDLVVKNTGSSAATGEALLQLEYRYKGY
jgi:hypothetical protein